MRDAGGEFTQRSHFFGLNQLRLRRFKINVGLLDLLRLLQFFCLRFQPFRANDPGLLQMEKAISTIE